MDSANDFTVNELMWLLSILGLVGVVALASKLYQARRLRRLTEAASSIGFFPAPEDISALPQMNLFSKGNGEAGYRNNFVGSAGGFEAQIFDYWYVQGSGKYRHKVSQTVAAFHLPGANMPDFQIAPRTFFSKLRAVFRRDYVRFEGHPEFSEHYVVRGADAVCASTVFTPGILSFLGARRYRFHIDGYFDWIIIYLPSKRVSPAKLREFIDTTAEIATGLLSQVPRPLAR